jgi:hypothetical protein
MVICLNKGTYVLYRLNFNISTFWVTISLNFSIEKVRFICMLENLHLAKKKWLHAVTLQGICKPTTRKGSFGSYRRAFLKKFCCRVENWLFSTATLTFFDRILTRFVPTRRAGAFPFKPLGNLSVLCSLSTLLRFLGSSRLTLRCSSLGECNHSISLASLRVLSEFRAGASEVGIVSEMLH